MKTKEELDKLNKQQEDDRYHPLTCCSHNNCKRLEQKNDGRLIATDKYWICPCGDYKQKYR